MLPVRGQRVAGLVALALVGSFLSGSLAEAARADDKPPATPSDASNVDSGTAAKADAPIEKLLARLKEQNGGDERFRDAWCRTLKEIVDLGPAAVPSLVRELDATDNDMMFRCMGFTLRAIGDKRAVPALIRALPETLVSPGSDMGLQAVDPELLAFAQKHDLDPMDLDNRYVFGRPVREISGALRTLTGENHGEEELYHVMLGGSKSQRQLKRRLYRQVAGEWADWWKANWQSQTDDRAYAAVGLPPIEEVSDIPAPALDSRFKTGGGNSNWILESVRNPQANEVFYDFDIGRAGTLPKRWKEGGDIASHEKEIVLWATLQGFDLMGTEYLTPDGKSVFALRSLGMQTWELPRERWKAEEKEVTLKSLQELGRSAGPYLLHRPAGSDLFAPEEHAPFLFITRHGTPGLLFVGIPVLDDSQKTGRISTGDDELDPVHFWKGRRFGFSVLEPVGE